MEKLLKILRSVESGVDFESDEARNLVNDGLLDSLDIVTIVTRISEEFHIEVEGDDVEPENFQSAQTMWDMIQRIQKRGRE